jgi:L-cystine transport system permease protein
LNQLAICFVSFIRGTPILIQMFIVYFGLPPLLRNLGIDISSWDKIYFIFVTYGINTGAYFSEIFRSSILSVPKAQTDAALSVGLSRRSTYTRIILPQSVPIAIPGVGIMMTNLLQDSSLAFAFGILDVIGKARTLGQLRNRTIEGYVVSATIFVLLAIGIEKSFALLEKRNRVNATSK